MSTQLQPFPGSTISRYASCIRTFIIPVIFAAAENVRWVWSSRVLSVGTWCLGHARAHGIPFQ